MEKLLSKKDVLEMLGIKESTLYCWVYRKKIPYVKLGKRTLRFKETDIRQWIADREVHPQIAEVHQEAKRKRVPSRLPTADNHIENLIKSAKRQVLKK